MPLHADARGLNPGLFFLVYATTLTLVRQPAGRLSDRRGRAPVGAAGLVVVAVALVTTAFTEGLVGLLCAGIVYGIGHGIAQPALIAWCVDGVAAGERGRAMGTFYTALELGIAIGSMTAGLAVAQAGFAVTFLVAAGIALAAAALARHVSSAGRGRARPTISYLSRSLRAASARICCIARVSWSEYRSSFQGSAFMW